MSRSDFGWVNTRLQNRSLTLGGGGARVSYLRDEILPRGDGLSSPPSAGMSAGAAGTSAGTSARATKKSALQVLVEEIERSLPGQLGGGLVVTGSCIVVETVVRALIHVSGVGDVVDRKSTRLNSSHLVTSYA